MANDFYQISVKSYRDKLVEYGFEFENTNWNTKAFQDGVLVCNKFQLSAEQEQEVIRKAEKVKDGGTTVAKKFELKKDDGKLGFAGKGKDATKKIVLE